MKPRASLVVLVFTLWVMTTLMGCAPATARNPSPTSTSRPAVELATPTPLPPDGMKRPGFHVGSIIWMPRFPGRQSDLANPREAAHRATSGPPCRLSTAQTLRIRTNL